MHTYGPPRADAAPQPQALFDLGDFVLRSGVTLRGAKLAYKTHGRLNADKSNLVVYPTPYSAHHSDIEWPIGPGKALDPERYFIVVTDMLGNGLSSSPSNTPPPFDRAHFRKSPSTTTWWRSIV
jgi:homoserine O-acetyltransferase